jgi:hypothetical protein
MATTHSRKFLVPLGLLAVANDPAGGAAGDSYYNTTINAIKTFDGTSWNAITGGTSLADLDGGNATSNYGGITSINAGTATG